MNLSKHIFTAADQAEEKAEAFDLLDALSRSGALPIESGVSLHVVLAATHCFDQTLMDTVVQGNVNPIERVERSLLIVAGVVHGRPARGLLQPAQARRIAQFAPKLMLEDADAETEVEAENAGQSDHESQ
jgi:hypothetical protein